MIVKFKYPVSIRGVNDNVCWVDVEASAFVETALLKGNWLILTLTNAKTVKIHVSNISCVLEDAPLPL